MPALHTVSPQSPRNVLRLSLLSHAGPGIICTYGLERISIKSQAITNSNAVTAVATYMYLGNWCALDKERLCDQTHHFGRRLPLVLSPLGPGPGRGTQRAWPLAPQLLLKLRERRQPAPRRVGAESPPRVGAEPLPCFLFVRLGPPGGLFGVLFPDGRQ